MTQPPPPSQPQQPVPAGDAQLVLTVAEVLAAAITVADAMAVLGTIFAALKIRRDALEDALGIVMDHPPDRAGFYGSAGAQVARLNLVRRAQFLVASARRLTAVAVTAVSHGQNPATALAGAVSDERRWYGQHMIAGWTRQQAAAQADSAAMSYGPLLGWYTTIDAKTSLECWRADRHNFLVTQMPAIGYPGMVHPSCRCRPGPPIPGAPLVGAASVLHRDRTAARAIPVHRPEPESSRAGGRR